MPESLNVADELGDALRQALATGRPVKLSAVGAQKLQDRFSCEMAPVAARLRQARLEAHQATRNLILD